MGVPPVKNGPHPFLFFEDRPKAVLYGRDAILRVRDKWLIFNTIPQLWADVKYHVPTGFGFSPKGCFVCFLFLCPQHLSTEPRQTPTQ